MSQGNEKVMGGSYGGVWFGHERSVISERSNQSVIDLEIQGASVTHGVIPFCIPILFAKSLNKIALSPIFNAS